MGYTINNDNIYPVGSTICANENPAMKLTIKSYYNRIYYCSRQDDPAAKDLVYYQRELIAPADGKS